MRSIFPLEMHKEPLLPRGSRRYTIDGDLLHVRTLGAGAPGVAVVLLSGPTDSWASDSAWYALLQPLLARSVRTHAIDRAGQAFSGGDGSGGYARFGAQLEPLLARLGEDEVIVVAFASANLALHHHFAVPPAAGKAAARISGALLVDPDALHPDLVDFYASQAQPFQEPGLKRYVNAGSYDERARALRDQDAEHVQSLLSDVTRAAFDARYFERVLDTRLEHDRILARFTEIARYDEDVVGAARVAWPGSVPVWSFDTAFEENAVDAAETAEERARYRRWQEQSSAWMASLPGACHIRSAAREHIAPIAEAERLVELILALRDGQPCPAANGGSE